MKSMLPFCGFIERFFVHSFTGRDAENEGLYREQLEEILSTEKSSTRDIISGYKNLIRYYLHIGQYEVTSHL